MKQNQIIRQCSLSDALVHDHPGEGQHEEGGDVRRVLAQPLPCSILCTRHFLSMRRTISAQKIAGRMCTALPWNRSRRDDTLKYPESGSRWPLKKYLDPSNTTRGVLFSEHQISAPIPLYDMPLAEMQHNKRHNILGGAALSFPLL